MKILGLSALYHDSAAALVVDGRIIAAAQEERFTRIKHDSRFPQNALSYCLAEGKISATELDAVAFYEKPYQKLVRTTKSLIFGNPQSPLAVAKKLSQSARKANSIQRSIRETLGPGFEGSIKFIEHHLSHGASAFYPSPFEKSAILTIDGVGESDCTTIGYGEKSSIKILERYKYPNSLGLLYSALTYYLGFKVNSGEYKVMGLAPYGSPRFSDTIRDNLIEIRDDGTYQLNSSFFTFDQLTQGMVASSFCDLFKAPARRSESKLSQREADIAASLQLVMEDAILGLVNRTKRLTNSTNLCLAGGVALNCVANGKALRSQTFESLWIQPAAGDAGGALGAALHTHFSSGKDRILEGGDDSQQGSFLGPSYSDSETETYLESYGIPYEQLDDNHFYESVAESIANGEIVGWFQGRMEFGPRALGARSIIADPKNPKMQRRLNLKTKFRESFRPFAPSVLKADAQLFFDIEAESPYMLLVSQTIQDSNVAFKNPSETVQPDGPIRSSFDQTKIRLPAITHVDGSARVQTVDAKRNPRFHRLLEAFKRRTGIGVLVNTSFNVRGEPIVCTLTDAYRTFIQTDIDILAIGNFIIRKSEQPEHLLKQRTARYLDKYELD